MSPVTLKPIGGPILSLAGPFQLVTHDPDELSFATRLLPSSATYTLPTESTPTSRGCANCSVPEPNAPTRHSWLPAVSNLTIWSLPVSAAMIVPSGETSTPD